MSYEERLQLAEEFIRRTAEEVGTGAEEEEIQIAIAKAAKALPPFTNPA